jgi:hypothetical protein
MLKFYYNGIKANGGKLQKASYWLNGYRDFPEGTITISARDYRRFSKEVAEAFTIQNDTDCMTDYFDSDRIRVLPFNPYYAQVKAAYDAQVAAGEKREEKWLAKRRAAQEARAQTLQTLMMDQRRRA